MSEINLYLQKHLSYLQVRGYRQGTIDNREFIVKRFITWCEMRDIEDVRLISRPVLESYQRYLFYFRRKNGEPFSMATQAKQLTSVKMFFKWLARDNHIIVNPAAELELPKVRKQLPRAILSIDEVQHLLSQPDTRTPQGVRDRAILEMLYSTGLRRTELATVKVQDVDLKASTVFVREGKGGYQRLLPIGVTAIKWLNKYMHDTRHLFFTGMDTHVLFLTDYGESFIKARLSVVVKRYMKAANINKEGAAHLLRHAMATHMLENGADIRFIQEMLGHQKLDTTQIYTRVAIAALKKVHLETHPSGVE